MNDVGLAKTLRAPVQGRSKASYERMLAAAEELLRRKGSAEFTLNEVSRQGKVSIGSIYNRFESKEDLLHSVQLRVLERVDSTMEQRLNSAMEASRTLPQLVSGMIDALAETLREYQDVLGPLMSRATDDPLVAQTGKASYKATASAFTNAVLAYRHDIAHPDPRRSIEAVFRVIYGAIARYLGLGSTSTAAWEGEWTILKDDLGRMATAYLIHPVSCK
jgi:AcrR family transcriptional regulator